MTFGVRLDISLDIRHGALKARGRDRCPFSEMHPRKKATRIMFFSVFNDQEVHGDWKLIAEALANIHAGQLNSRSIYICTDSIDYYTISNDNQLKGSFPLDYSYNNR